MSEQKEKADPTPFLPGLPSLPDEPQLVEIVQKSSNPTFTGTVAVRDFERAKAICAAVISGMGVVATATKFKCSTRTVHNIIRIMRERGELGPITEHIMQRLEEIIDVGTEVWHDALERGKIHPNSIPIPILAAIDKRAQLAVGVVTGTGRTATEIKAGDVEAAFQLMRSGNQPTPTQSTDSHSKPQQMQASQDLDNVLDNAEVVDPVLPGQLPGPAASTERDSQTPGGGEVDGGTPPSMPLDSAQPI